MDLSQICTNCFKYKGVTAICPHCGKESAPIPEESYHLFPGSLLCERYLIGEVIDSGGFGIVYKALDLKLSSIIAVKEYFPTSLMCRVPGNLKVSIFSGERALEYQKGIARFLKEAKMMAKFSKNNHIVNVMDYFTENNTAYIVMEYLEGVTLNKYLKANNNKISVNEALSIIKPVLEGLSALHNKNIFHRDINPRNIMLTVDNNIKIIDFGTASFFDDDSEEIPLVVSDGFAAPEQYTNKVEQGEFTDIYSVGATLYRAIVGETPLVATDRQMKDNLRRPSELVSDVPKYVDASIMKALALKTDMRFISADEMLEALTEESEVEYPEVILKKRERKRNILVFVSLILTIAVVGILIWMNQEKDILYERYKNSIKDVDYVSVLVPYDSKIYDSETEVKDTYDNLNEGFKKYTKKYYRKEIEIAYDLVDKSEYKEEVNKKIELGDMPFIYRSDIYDSSDIEKINLCEVYYATAEDLFCANDINNIYGNDFSRIPAGFNINMVYLNKDLTKKYNADYSWKNLMEDLPHDEKIYASKDAYPALYETLKNSKASTDFATNVIWNTLNNGKVRSDDESVKTFVEGKQHSIFVGSNKNSKEIRGDYVAIYGGSTKNIFDNDSKLYGYFSEEWSISNKGEHETDGASLVFLKYYLSDEGQESIRFNTMTKETTLSVNKNVLIKQKDNDSIISDIMSDSYAIDIISKETDADKFSKELFEFLKDGKKNKDNLKGFIKKYFN